jgi:hypothetical protein
MLYTVDPGYYSAFCSGRLIVFDQSVSEALISVPTLGEFSFGTVGLYVLFIYFWMVTATTGRKKRAV